MGQLRQDSYRAQQGMYKSILMQFDEAVIHLQLRLAFEDAANKVYWSRRKGKDVEDAKNNQLILNYKAEKAYINSALSDFVLRALISKEHNHYLTNLIDGIRGIPILGAGIEITSGSGIDEKVGEERIASEKRHESLSSIDQVENATNNPNHGELSMQESEQLQFYFL